MSDQPKCPDCKRSLPDFNHDASVSAVCWERGSAMCVRVQRDALRVALAEAERERDEARADLTQAMTDFGPDADTRSQYATMRQERDTARAQLAAAEDEATTLPHASDRLCPSYYDGCHCLPQPSYQVLKVRLAASEAGAARMREVLDSETIGQLRSALESAETHPTTGTCSVCGADTETEDHDTSCNVAEALDAIDEIENILAVPDDAGRATLAELERLRRLPVEARILVEATHEMDRAVSTYFAEFGAQHQDGCPADLDDKGGDHEDCDCTHIVPLTAAGKAMTYARSSLYDALRALAHPAGKGDGQ